MLLCCISSREPLFSPLTDPPEHFELQGQRSAALL
ncbi:hypothetical protein MPC1_3480005 [Methylocella tundrae]|nr:hypothetical protein MPC1_3480005 [Methylocella tundrae]